MIVTNHRCGPIAEECDADHSFERKSGVESQVALPIVLGLKQNLKDQVEFPAGTDLEAIGRHHAKCADYGNMFPAHRLLRRSSPTGRSAPSNVEGPAFGEPHMPKVPVRSLSWYN